MCVHTWRHSNPVFPPPLLLSELPLAEKLETKYAVGKIMLLKDKYESNSFTRLSKNIVWILFSPRRKYAFLNKGWDRPTHQATPPGLWSRFSPTTVQMMQTLLQTPDIPWVLLNQQQVSESCSCQCLIVHTLVQKFCKKLWKLNFH